MSESLHGGTFSGLTIGNCCDRCNAGLRNGDPVRFYATRCDNEDWLLRRVYCTDCGDTELGADATTSVDEALGEGVWLQHRLHLVRISDLSLSTRGGEARC